MDGSNKDTPAARFAQMSSEEQLDFIAQIDDQKLAAFAPDLEQRRKLAIEMRSVLHWILWDLDEGLPGLEANIAEAERDLRTAYDERWLREELSRLDKEIPMLTSRRREWQAALDRFPEAREEKQAVIDKLASLRETLAADKARFRDLKIISYELMEASAAIANGTPDRRVDGGRDTHVVPLSPEARRLYGFLGVKDAEDTSNEDESDGKDESKEGEDNVEEDDGED